MLEGANNSLENTVAQARLSDYRGGTSAKSRVIDFWKDFNVKLREYISDMSDKDEEYVRIDGEKFDKDNEYTLIYKMDQWQTDVTSALDGMLKNIKTELELAEKLDKMF